MIEKFIDKHCSELDRFMYYRVSEHLIHDMDEFLLYDADAVYESGKEEEYKHISLGWDKEQ